MKTIKNKTHYTIKKGMGDVVIGEIICYANLGCRLYLSQKDQFPGLDKKDVEFILNEMTKLEEY